MALAILQQKLSSFSEEYFDEINDFFDFLTYKAKSINKTTQKKQTITPGLAMGKWKYPTDINAFDEDITNEFESYL